MKFIPDDGSEPIELSMEQAERLLDVKLPDSWVGPAPKAGLLGTKAGEQYLELLAKNRTSRRGVFEELFRPELSDLPVVGVAEVPYLLGVANTARKLSKGEDVDDESLINLNFYLETAKRKENATLGSKVVDVVQQSLSLGAEMAATTALFGAGLAATATGAGAPVGAGAMGLGAAIGAKTAAKAAATKTARLAVAQMVRRVAGKSASKLAKKVMTSSMRGQAAHQALGEALEKGTYNFAKKFAGEGTAKVLSKIAKVGGDLESRGLVGMLLNPARDAQNYAHRRLNDALAGGDETVAMSIAKAFLDTNIEVASEFSGEYLGKIASKFMSPKMKKLMAQASVASWLGSKMEAPTVQAISGAFKSLGIGSTIEEMAEERVGGFLKGLFGVEGEAGLLNAIRNAGWKDGEHFATEAIAFSIMPILAHGVRRVAGGQSFGEQARAMELFRDVGLPDPDIAAKTPEQMRDDARRLDKALRDEEEFWFSNTPFRFLEKVLGTKRRGAVAGLFQGLGLANMRAVHDLALKRNPENPEAGIDAIADYLTNLQAVQTRGINTPADAEAFNAGVKNGDISINRSTGVAWVTKQSMTKPEIEVLAKQTGISYMVPIDEMDDKARIGEITIPDQGPAWDDLSPDQRKQLSLRWGTTDQAALKEKHDFLRKVIPLSKAKTSHESIPVLVSATAEQWEAETGYPLPEGAVPQGKNDNGEDFYVFHARGMTSADGETIDLSTKADIGDITEENIEAAMKQTNGINLSPAMNAWVDSVYSGLVEKEDLTKEERTILEFTRPTNKQGRFEFVVKSYMANALGYQKHSSAGMRLLPFGKQEIPREVDMQLRAIVGQGLLDAMAFVPMAKPAASEAYTAVVDAMTSPVKAGRADKVRAAVAQAAESATVNKLKALLEGDMRKKETLDSIIDLLNKETFSLETMDPSGEGGVLSKAFTAMKKKRRSKKGESDPTPESDLSPRVKVYENSLKKPANHLANMQQDMDVVAGRIGETVDMDADPFAEAQRLLKIAAERKDIENVRRLGKHLWIKLPEPKDVTPHDESGIPKEYTVNPAASRDVSGAEPRYVEESSPGRTLTMYGASMRRDYWETTGDMDVEDFAPVFGEEEIRAVLPDAVLTAAAIAEKAGEPDFLDRIIENIDLIDPMEVARRTVQFLESQKGAESLANERPVTKASPSRSTDEQVERIAKGIAFVKAKILKGDRLYDPSIRSMERTVNVKKSATTEGKRMLTARATTSKPFSPEDTQSMLPIKSEEIADAEREEIEAALAQSDESFNPEQKAPEQRMLQKTPPRDASAMEPLDDRPIGQQLKRIIAYGGQAISRVVQYVTKTRPHIQVVDRILIPPTSNEIKGMKNGVRWERNPETGEMRPVFANGAAWVSHMGRSLLPSHSVENIPLLSKGKDAILNEELDAEAVIFVHDNTDYSAEYELGMPLERLQHAARNAMYPSGRVYARWKKVPIEGSLDENGQPQKVSPSNTYKLVREVDDNDVRSEIDQIIARVDFFSSPEEYTRKADITETLRKLGATEAQIAERFEFKHLQSAEAPLDMDVNQQVHRAAVIPLSAAKLERAGKKNGGQLVKTMGSALHSFMIKNRIRSVIIAGMDQIEDEADENGQPKMISWKASNGDTMMMPKRVLVPGEWEVGLRRVLRNAFGPRTDQQQKTDSLKKRTITPGTKKAIQRARKAAIESDIPIREDAGIKPPVRKGEEALPDANETFSLLAVDQKLISDSMTAAKDLLTRLNKAMGLDDVPMPDKWMTPSVTGAALNYEKRPDGKWDQWIGPKSNIQSPDQINILDEDVVRAEWLGHRRRLHGPMTFEKVAVIVEEWKKANNIVYDPREAYARGEGFFHDLFSEAGTPGAFNPKAREFWQRLSGVLLRQSRDLRKGNVKYWQNPENQVVVSAYTAAVRPVLGSMPDSFEWFISGGRSVRVAKNLNGQWVRHIRDESPMTPSDFRVLESKQISEEDALQDWTAHGKIPSPIRPGSGPRFVIRPSWQDIVWAAVGDVYSGTASNKGGDNTAVPLSVSELPAGLRGWDAVEKLNADNKDRNVYYWMHMGEVVRGLVFDPDVKPKAPHADKLRLLSNSIAAAIEGRLPYHYNELGIRLRLGNFYIDNEGFKWTAEYNPNMIGGPRWVLRNPEGLLTGRDFASEAEALAAVEDLSGIPPELRRLNKFLKQAFERVHGSLDPVSPYEPKQIKRASGVAETFSMEAADQLINTLFATNYNRTVNRAPADSFVRAKTFLRNDVPLNQQGAAVYKDKQFQYWAEHLFYGDTNKDRQRLVRAILSSSTSLPVLYLFPGVRVSRGDSPIGLLNPTIFGSYNPGTGSSAGRIAIFSKGMESVETLRHTLAHELFHHLGVNMLKDDSAFQERIEALWEHAQWWANHHAGVVGHYKMFTSYGFTNPSEFLVEALSNPGFESLLKTIPGPNAKISEEAASIENQTASTWMDIVRAFLSIMKGMFIGTRYSGSETVWSDIMSSLPTSLRNEQGSNRDQSSPGPSFSMEPLSLTKSKKLENRMLAGVKRFNNNRYIPPDEMSVYRGWIRKAIRGDESGKRWLARNLTEADKEAFKGFLPTPEPIGAPMGIPVAPEGIQEANPPEAGQMDLFTYSLEPLQDMIDTLAPQYRSGAPGMHKLFLNLSHNLNAVQFKRTKEVEALRYKLGLLGPQKNLPDGHKKQVEDVLTAIGAKLDGSERIPIGWNEQGEVEWLAASPRDMMDDWDTYRETNGLLEMPTADDLLVDLRGRFNAVRQEFNKLVEDFSDEEWIRYLNDYLPHIYAFRNIEQRDNFIRSMREQTGRALKRTFETYQVAAEVKGIVPKTMNALDLFQMYNETVLNTVKNRVLVNTASLIRDIDGAPLVIPVKLGGAPASKNSLVSPETLRQTGRHLAEFLGVAYDPSNDPAQEIERLVGMLDVSGNDYERMDSPLTKSVDYFIVRKGTPSNLLKMVLGYGRMNNALINGISAYNNWSKFLMLGFSAFHPFALMESMAATFGITKKNPAFHWLKTKQDLAAIVKEMRENPEKYAHWVRRGLMIPTTSPDIQMSMIAKHIDTALTALRGSEGYSKHVLIPALKSMRWYKEKVDLWLWNQFQPAMKLYGADFLMNEWEGQHPNATEAEREEAGEAIARHINRAFGGLDWMEFAMATPKALQLLHAGMFAPDWTFAAADISGMTRLPILNKMHRMPLTGLEKDLMIKKYWPAMIGIVLLGLPNLVQAAIYAAFGDPDDDDVPFNFMNEAGKRTAIDFTPIFRHLPGYDGGETGKRRVFMRWGKQAYEVSEGWFGDPAMILRKSSSSVRQVFEQVTGSSPTGWDLPFKGEGFMGLIAGKENSQTSRFMGSRIGNIVKNFVPISMQAAAKGEFTSFIAPSSKGATMGRMINEMKEAMTSYVESYRQVTRIDLEAAVTDQIDALRRNGYDPAAAVDTAKRAVKAIYYRKFFEALNSGNDSELEDVAQKILVLGGTFQQVMASVESRLRTSGQPVTDETVLKVRHALMKHSDRML